ncbi:MAG TPA: BatA domain-containing protein [Methylomirabilota bacterium]|nr:BatA domain-containing protein [Methylomirabilota bacterium]
MSFLAPLFLVGAAAIALPILFHLIRRTTRERMPFSSLMFLRPSPPRVTRRSRLENILLLLLRCLVLCLLAVGFARPFLQRPMPAPPDAEAGRRIVVLVDTSASMQRGGLWDEARAKAQQRLRAGGANDSFAVFTFDRQPHALLSFEEWTTLPVGDRVAVAGQRLATAHPGSGSTHLGRALLAAAELLQDRNQTDTENRPGGGEIVVISDFQDGSRLEGLQGFDWPRGVEVVFDPVKARRKTNAGLQVLPDLDETARPQSEARPRLRVSNAAESEREQFRIGWVAGNSSSFLGPPLDVYVPPGQSRVFEAPAPPAGMPAERLALTGDDEPFDNVAFVAPPRRERTRVLFLGDDSGGDHTHSLYYLRRAFLETRFQEVQILQRSNHVALTSSDLDPVHLFVCVDSLPADRVRMLKDRLSAGGIGLFALSSAAAAPTVAALVGVDSIAVTEATPAGYALLGQIDFSHPMFAAFADPRFSDFTKIHFWRHRRLETNQIPGARVLARFDSGDPALLQIPVGRGTLFVLTAGWIPADSQLALSSKFVPWLYSLLEMAGGFRVRVTQHVVGDELDTGTGSTNTATRLRKPDGALETLSPDRPRSPLLDIPGIYALESQQSTQRFAVNLDPAESLTTPLPAENLERLGLPTRPTITSQDKKSEEKLRHLQATELESRQKLWRWLLAAALAALLVETWVAGRAVRTIVDGVPAGRSGST